MYICSLECKIDQDQTITWTYIADNDEERIIIKGEVVIDSSYKVEISEKSSTLIIPKVWLSQEGYYGCYRGNLEDENYITHEVNVDGIYNNKRGNEISNQKLFIGIIPRFITTPTFQWVLKDDVVR